MGSRRTQSVAAEDDVVVSPLLPGGDLVAAVLDRQVMRLADRGGASGLVGGRWADLCAEQVAGWSGRPQVIPGSPDANYQIERVVRLDDTPAIAAAASKQALQNPDFLLIGTDGGRPVIQAADAKFSVETARSKQVSPGVVTALWGLGDLVSAVIGEVATDIEVVPGIFLCPDFSLTHLMLRRRQGILRVTAQPEEVSLLPAPAGRFFAPLSGAAVMAPLALLDALPISIQESLLVSLYYFRLARACIGCWLDATAPLLLVGDAPRVDEAAVAAETSARTHQARSAYDLVLIWHADVQTIRNERAAVDQVTALPLPSRDLRELALRMATAAGTQPPSTTQIRRRLGAWYRAQLRERVGPLDPPVSNFSQMLLQLGVLGAALVPDAQREAERIIADLMERPPAALVSVSEGMAAPDLISPNGRGE